MDEGRLRESSRPSNQISTEDAELVSGSKSVKTVTAEEATRSGDNITLTVNGNSALDTSLASADLEDDKGKGKTTKVNGTLDVNRNSPQGPFYESSMVAAESRPPKPQTPHEIVTYSKATQTSAEPDTPRESDLDAETERERLVALLREEIAEEMRAKERDLAVQASASVVPFPGKRILSDNERTGLLQSTDYNEFLVKTAKVLEDVLAEEAPQEVDYTADYEEVQAQSSSATMRQVVQFQDEQTRGRIIISIDWSIRFHELVLVTYSKHQSLVGEIQGLIYVWNCKQPSKPQFIFECQTELQRAIFSPYHPQLIIGATSSGQILLWNTRARSQPVLASPLIGKGHTYPVTGLDIVGTRQANSILSTSSDGLVCTWSVDMLAQPNDTVELALLPPSRVEEVSPTAVTHSSSDTLTFLVGTDDGNIYSVNRQDRAGSKAGIDPRIVYKGHAAMITGLQYHVSKGVVDFSDLVLSSSLDWSIKVWRVRTPLITSVSQNTATAMTQGPLVDLPTEEIVYDVKWSPSRPGVFASVDGAGDCNIYDLSRSFEVPVSSGRPKVIDPDTGKAMPARALNKVAWDHDFGRQVAVGGINGTLTVFEVPEGLGGKESDHETWYKLNNRLKSLA